MTSAGPIDAGEHQRRTFFISRAGPDKERAKLIAGWLEEAGYRTFLQDWDIEPGADFQAAIHRSLAGGAHVVALLSEHYLRSPWCQMEWNAATKAQVETGQARLMPLRIDTCQPPGLITLAVFIDLANDAEESARRKILTAAASIGQIERKGGSWSTPSPANRPRVDNLEAFDPDLFAGRQDELLRLHERLDLPSGTAVAVTALAGLGGVGKSALARAYCHAHQAEYEVIWWVRSEDENDLRNDLAQLAIAWDPGNAILGSSEAQAREAVRIASSWSGQRPFLLVFDNVVSPSTLRNYRPTGACRIVVTSRNTSWGREWRPLMVRKLDPDTGAKLLMRASGRGDYEGARKIAVELDGLALPLSHAAAILRENMATTIDDLLRRYDTFMQLQTDDADVRTTYATYSVALEDLAKKNPISKDVMSAAAYCAPEGISAAILEQSCRSRMESALVVSPSDTSDRIADALGALARYAMVDIERTEGGDLRVSVHRVVQRVVRRHHLDKNERAAWGCATLAALNTKVGEKRVDARRHAKEALAIVPADLCPDTYKALTLAIDGDVVIGRERELELLHTLLSERGARTVLVQGAAGTGKSSLARLYASQHRGDYSDIWFVDGSSRETARQTLTDAAAAAGTRATSGSLSDRTAEALGAASGARTLPVLIIVDNAEGASFLPGWIEATLGSKFIVCSRDASPFPADATIRLAKLTRPESLALLRRQGVSVSDSEAIELSEYLGNLPLALMQAANYLSQPGAPSVATYLQQLKSANAQARGTGADSASVNEAIAAQYLALPVEAQALLRAICVCADAEIPHILISHLGAASPDIGSSDVAMQALEGVLQRRMAVAKGSDLAGAYFTVHPILSETIRRTLPADRLNDLANTMLGIVPGLIPTSHSPADLALSERLIHHALAAVGFAHDPLPERVALNLFLSGGLQLQLGNAAQAAKQLERSLSNWEDSNQLGAEYASTMGLLATALIQLGKMAEARRMAERGVAFAERYYGQNNPGMSDALLRRAASEFADGDVAAAEASARRVTEIQIAKPEHPALMTDALLLIGQIQARRTDLPAAEVTFRAALNEAERAGDALRTASILSALADIEHATSRSDAAARHLRDAITIRESILGEEHPETATSLTSLAGVLQKTGKLVESEHLFRRALAVYESATGTNQATIAIGLVGLARNLAAAKRWSEVVPLAQRALFLLESAADPLNMPLIAEVRQLVLKSSQTSKAGASDQRTAPATLGTFLQSIFRFRK
jgi:tetratricopeptide (TPR) repeat protein